MEMSRYPDQQARHSEKILPRHLERLAVVYVRQSTMQQVLDHQESTRLQYGLVERAQALGWPEHRVLIIDDDLGKSGSSPVKLDERQRGTTRLSAAGGGSWLRPCGADPRHRDVKASALE
jgi:hypothetical protein